MFVTALVVSILGAQFKDVPPSSQKRLLKSVYYVPFGFQTYTPITAENIEAQGVNVVAKLRTKEQLLLRILRPHGKAAKIDPKKIRLKVATTKGEVIFMDANFVAKIGAKSYLLSEKSQAVVDAMFYEDWMISRD